MYDTRREWEKKTLGSHPTPQPPLGSPLVVIYEFILEASATGECHFCK